MIKVHQKYVQKKVSEKNLERIQNCGSFLLFHTDEGKEKKKLVHANNCENRFCPMCAYKKSRKDAMKISIMLKYLENDCQFLFLTLTSPNVTSDNLVEEIKDYNESFKRMTKLKPFMGAVIGYIRKLEIIYDGSKKITKEMYEKKKKSFARSCSSEPVASNNFLSSSCLSVFLTFFTLETLYLVFSLPNG